MEPGGIATEWGAISAENLIKTSGNGVYAEQARKTAERMDQMYASGKLSDPEVIGRIIVKAVTAARPRTRYAAGAMSGLVLFLRRWLTDRAFDRLVESMA